MKSDIHMEVPLGDWQPLWVERLRTLVFLHFGVVLVLATWGYGGQAPWVRQGLAGMGAVGVLLTGILIWNRMSWERGSAGRWFVRLWPLIVFNVWVAISCANPSFRDITLNGQLMMVSQSSSAYLPSAARPDLAWRELWLQNVLFLLPLNLLVVVRSRKEFRWVWIFVGTNALLLAVLGTVQNLLRYDGLWFGRVVGPNSEFFATFVYRNHWAAFALLSIALWFGIMLSLRSRQRPLSPVFLWGGIGVVLLAVTIPLSGSRSGLFLLAVLIIWGGFRLTDRFRGRIPSGGRRIPNRRTSILMGLILVFIIWVGSLAQERLEQRWDITLQQLDSAADSTNSGGRIPLYRDTWRMIQEKPIAGWGLGSYAHVFRRFNTSVNERGQQFYDQAHSNWLQSLAEVGVGGTLVRVSLVFSLLAGRWRRIWASSVSRCLLVGCGITLIYGALEFPFANPAVALVFWILLLSAGRWVDFSHRKPLLASRSSKA